MSDPVDVEYVELSKEGVAKLIRALESAEFGPSENQVPSDNTSTPKRTKKNKNFFIKKE